MTSDRINFVDKQQTGRVLFGLGKHVAHPRSTHADKHLDEIRTGNRKERNVGFAGHRFGQERLAGSRRTDQQNALRYLAAQTLKFAGIFQKVDHFFQLLFGFVTAGHIGKRHLLAVFQKPRARLAETHCFAVAGIGLTHKKDPNPDQQNHREPGNDDSPESVGGSVFRLGIDHHVVFAQGFDHGRIIRRISVKLAAVGISSVYVRAGNRHFGNPVVFRLIHKLGKRQFAAGGPGRRSLSGHVGNRGQQNDRRQPED